MKQLENQKSISWFKLAEFVERGEKERALGIYKLLALSIHDTAFTYQLEGDILLAFDDQQAITKYLQAAQHYIQQNNILSAIGVLNHVVILAPNQTIAWDLLTKLYLDHFLTKIIIHLRNLINNQQITSAKNTIEQIIITCQKETKPKELEQIMQDIKRLDLNLYQFALQVKTK